MAEKEGTKTLGQGDIIIRQFRDEDIPAVVDWTMKEHWHVSNNIVRANYLLDPDGFFAACDSDGQVIGSWT